MRGTSGRDESSSGAQLDALRAATIDVGLLRESPEDDDLISETVVRERFIALLPIGHRLAARTRVAPSALAAESFIMFQRDVAPTLHDQIAAVCREGDFSPRVKHEANEWLTVAGLVGAGMGVSIAPAGVRQLRWRGVAYRPIRPSRVQTSITVCRRREPSRGAIDGFVGILREVTGHDAAK